MQPAVLNPITMNKGIKITRLKQGWTTESGFYFPEVEIAWKSWGRLNAQRDNVILICHALTGHAAADEWFGEILGGNGLPDPEKHFLICINVPGSCYGSTGPVSQNPETGLPYKADFPELTIRDFVRFQQLLLDHLNIQGIQSVIGGSMGGMTALEFLIMDSRVKSGVLLAAPAAHSAWAIGISHAQRSAIQADKNWNEGYYDKQNPPLKGLAAAREMAMITYRSPGNYTSKFGRHRENAPELFSVESYLSYQGEKLTSRFDANAYITLSKAMDTHDPGRLRGGLRKVLAKTKQPVLIIGIESDHLYPPDEQRKLADLLPNGNAVFIQSPYGHDAFLIESDQINRHLKEFYTSNQFKSRSEPEHEYTH